MRLGEGRPLIAESYKEVTIIFADLVGFTTMSSKIKASELIHLLNGLFSKWDRICAKYKVEKIKTIGDCYMAAVGVPERLVDHAHKAVEFAIEMLQILDQFNRDTENELKIRIGINSGSVVAGVIGVVKMQYDIWGDAVNVASRMESSGVENRIQVSHNTFELTQDEYMYEERGSVDIKGKGKMLVYLYKSRKYEVKKDGTKVRKPAISPMSSSTYISGFAKEAPSNVVSKDLVPSLSEINTL